MRRDSIFYKLFSQFPDLLFELMPEPPPHAIGYQFESIEVKETAFRIDGVFLPPDNADPNIVCFAEVQLQKDEDLYNRYFAEIHLFLHRTTSHYQDWCGVLVMASRRLEPSNAYLHRALLEGPQVQQIYLDELAASERTSLGIQLIQLTMATEATAIQQARHLLAKVPQLTSPEQSESTIIDLITTIMVYRLNTLSRGEIEAMLGLNLSESRVLREERQEGWQEGRQEGERSLVLRQLARRVGSLPEPLVAQIQTLPLVQLETLGEALLDFADLTDLETWLQTHP
jgi:predicted transposase/invertase (TIGR01784 family)